MKKSIIALVLVMVMLFSTACSGESAEVVTTTVPVQEEVQTPTVSAEEKTYVVSFAGGDGASGEMTPIEYGAGDTFVIPQNEFTKSGYTFAGFWDGWSTVLAGEEYVMPAVDVTMTAMWKANSSGSSGGSSGSSSGSSSDSSSGDSSAGTLSAPVISVSADGQIAWQEASGVTYSILGEEVTSPYDLSVVSGLSSVQIMASNDEEDVYSDIIFYITSLEGVSMVELDMENQDIELYIIGDVIADGGLKIITTASNLYIVGCDSASASGYVASESASLYVVGTFEIYAPQTHVENYVATTATDMVLSVSENTYQTGASVQTTGENGVTIAVGSLVVSDEISTSKVTSSGDGQTKITVENKDSDVPEINISGSGDAKVEVNTDKDVNVDSENSNLDIDINKDGANVTSNGTAGTITVSESSSGATVTNNGSADGVTVNGENATVVNTQTNSALQVEVNGSADVAGNITSSGDGTTTVKTLIVVCGFDSTSLSRVYSYGDSSVSLTLKNPTYTVVSGSSISYDLPAGISVVPYGYEESTKTCTGYMASANVGSSKAVTVDFVVEGEGAEGYIVCNEAITCSVTKQTVDVSGIALLDPDKVYAEEDWYIPASDVYVPTLEGGLTLEIVPVTIGTTQSTPSYSDWLDTRTIDGKTRVAKVLVIISGDSALNYTLVSDGAVLATYGGNYYVTLKYDVEGSYYQITYFTDFSQREYTYELIERGGEYEITYFPSVPNKIFVKWCSNEDFTTPALLSGTIENNIELYAYFVNTATITFDFGGTMPSNESDFASITVDVGNKVEDTVATPILDGYTFEGWFADSSRTITFDFDSEISANTTVYAKWSKENAYALYFETNGGDNIDTQFVTSGESVVLPETPAKTGSTFVGWYSTSQCDGEAITSVVVSADTTVYAKWKDSELEISTKLAYTYINEFTYDDVTYPAGYAVTGIGTETLTQFAIPATHDGEAVRYVYGFAFEGESIEKIEVPYSVEVLGYFVDNALNFSLYAPSAFDEISGLQEIIVNQDNENYFSDGGVLYSKVYDEFFDEYYYDLVTYPSEKADTSFVILQDVVLRYGNSFFGATYLESILAESGSSYVVKDNLVYARSSDSTAYVVASAPNSSLTELTIGGYIEFDGVSYLVDKIGTEACANMVNLQTLVIAEGVETISGSAFRNCTSLTSISLPSTLSDVGEEEYLQYNSPFYGCDNVALVTLAEGNTYLKLTDGALTYANGTAIIVEGGKYTYQNVIYKLGSDDGTGNYTATVSDVVSGTLGVVCEKITFGGVEYAVSPLDDDSEISVARLNYLVVPEALAKNMILESRSTESLQLVLLSSGVYVDMDDVRSEYEEETEYDWSAVLANEDIPKMDMLFDIENGYVYEVCGDTLTLYKYIIDSNADGNVYIELTVPAEYDGKNVTTIANGAIASQYITKLVVSENITTIESGAVSSCENLAYIYIPSTVTQIDNYAFSILAYNVVICCEASEAEAPDGWEENWYKYRDWTNDGTVTEYNVQWSQSLS